MSNITRSTHPLIFFATNFFCLSRGASNSTLVQGTTGTTRSTKRVKLNLLGTKEASKGEERRGEERRGEERRGEERRGGWGRRGMEGRAGKIGIDQNRKGEESRS
eukprot:762505-Hanusia_phi.AAC.2